MYVLSSIILSYITVNKEQPNNRTKKIYLNTNGVHLSIILPVDAISKDLQSGIPIPYGQKYARFGWGDEEFYMNVPTWDDFKLKYALGALFLDKPTLMEVSYYRMIQEKWIEIDVTEEQLQKLNEYIAASFKLDEQQNKRLIKQDLYPDLFLYKANGSYSPVKTCNTWANSAFKQSGLKASWWTLFDFGLLKKYE